MDFGIKGKKAFVMASSKGLGKSVALELSNEGVEVMLCGRTLSFLESTAREITEQTGGKIHFVAGDVSKPEDRKMILNEINEKLKHVDILVTNSGGPPTGSFEQHDEQAWNDAYNLLLASTVDMIKGVLPYMKEQKSGRIITITSQAVKQPVDGLILSNSVRASIVGLVKTLASELGGFNITVNNVMPGYTQTERLEQLMSQNPDMSDNIKKEVPLNRVAQPKEFAAAVAFLASERASYITGVSLAIDGGWIKAI